MNTFILDRHTDPQNPTVTSVQNDRIPVYDTVADAEADLANLEVGQIVATKEVEKSLFDYIYPIGSTYTQYPDCASPNELWPDTTWTELDFNGAFFRATGGLAQAFDNQTSMQSQETAVNSLSASQDYHRHLAYMNSKNEANVSGGLTLTACAGSAANTGNRGSSYTSCAKPGITLTGGQETRPMNYTIKIWKRTA